MPPAKLLRPCQATASLSEASQSTSSDGYAGPWPPLPRPAMQDNRGVTPLTACVKVTPVNPGAKLLRAPAPEIGTGAWGPLQLKLAICTEMSDKAPAPQLPTSISTAGWWNNHEQFSLQDCSVHAQARLKVGSATPMSARWQRQELPEQLITRHPLNTQPALAHP